MIYTKVLRILIERLRYLIVSSFIVKNILEMMGSKIKLPRKHK